MKKLIALVFVFTLLLVGCKPKANKEQQATEEAPTEAVVKPYENVTESVERIDSVAAELESSIEKLDEALNELK